MAKNDLSNVTKVRGQLTVVNSQRQQYKPYSYELDFTPSNIFVEIDVPEENIIDISKDKVTINADGMSFILMTLADSLDKYETARFTKSKQTYGKIQ